MDCRITVNCNYCISVSWVMPSALLWGGCLASQNQHCLSRPDAAHSYHNPEEAIMVMFHMILSALWIVEMGRYDHVPL